MSRYLYGAILFLLSAMVTLNLVLGFLYGRWYSFVAAGWIAACAWSVIHNVRSINALDAEFERQIDAVMNRRSAP